MAGNNSIKVLRGTRANIAQSSETLEAGQILYNTDDNYISVGGPNGTDPVNKQPIKTRAIEGYFADSTGISSSTGTQYYIGPTSGDNLLIKSGNYNIALPQKTGTVALTSDINYPITDVRIDDVSIVNNKIASITSEDRIIEFDVQVPYTLSKFTYIPGAQQNANIRANQIPTNGLYVNSRDISYTYIDSTYTETSNTTSWVQIPNTNPTTYATIYNLSVYLSDGVTLRYSRTLKAGFDSNTGILLFTYTTTGSILPGTIPDIQQIFEVGNGPSHTSISSYTININNNYSITWGDNSTWSNTTTHTYTSSGTYRCKIILPTNFNGWLGAKQFLDAPWLTYLNLPDKVVRLDSYTISTHLSAPSLILEVSSKLSSIVSSAIYDSPNIIVLYGGYIGQINDYVVSLLGGKVYYKYQPQLVKSFSTESEALAYSQNNTGVICIY